MGQVLVPDQAMLLRSFNCMFNAFFQVTFGPTCLFKAFVHYFFGLPKAFFSYTPSLIHDLGDSRVADRMRTSF